MSSSASTALPPARGSSLVPAPSSASYCARQRSASTPLPVCHCPRRPHGCHTPCRSTTATLSSRRPARRRRRQGSATRASHSSSGRRCARCAIARSRSSCTAAGSGSASSWHWTCATSTFGLARCACWARAGNDFHDPLYNSWRGSGPVAAGRQNAYRQRE